MVLLRALIRQRQGKERSAVVLENIAAVTLDVSFRCARDEIEHRELLVGSCWVIDRSLRQGRWILKSSAGTCHPGPFSVQVLGAGMSEEWQFQADGPIELVYCHDNANAAAPPDNTIFQPREDQFSGITNLDRERKEKVLAAIHRSNLDGGGILDVSQLSAVLKALDDDIFSEERVSALLAQADGICEGKVDCRVFLQWVFEDQSPKDQFGHAHMSDVEDGDDQKEPEEEEHVDVEICWTTGSSETCSMVLHNVPVTCSLAELKVRCAASLQVVAVEPQDYSEDMDALTLAQLGIGSSGLPLAVTLLGQPEGPPVEQTRVPSAAAAAAPCVASSPALSSSRSQRATGAAPKAALGIRPPLAERQAREDLSEVVDGFLYLSGQMGAGNRAALRGLSVTHILNVCDRIPCKFKNDFTYKVVSVHDTRGSDIRKHFLEALEFIDTAQAVGGRCLVHCMVGASRSTSIVLAWLVSRCEIGLKDAYKDVRARRKVARPNRSFCEQLIEFELEVRGCRSATLADFGHAS